MDDPDRAALAGPTPVSALAALLAAGALALTAPPAAAQVSAGVQDADRVTDPAGFGEDVVPEAIEPGVEGTITSVVSIPFSLPPFEGGGVLASVLGPPGGANVWHAELQLGWEPAQGQPAQDLWVAVASHLEGGASPQWTVTGADLGFDATAAPQAGAGETNLLNGTLADAWYAGSSVLDLQVAGPAGAAWGTLVDARFVFQLGPRLAGAPHALSLSDGGAQVLDVNAGPLVGPGLAYVVFGSASGAPAAGAVDGLPLPFAVDAYTLATIAAANSGPFQGTLGVFDRTGRAAAAIVLPPGGEPALAGLVLRHAYALLGENAEVLGLSNAVELELVP